jgi:hypothetical protein
MKKTPLLILGLALIGATGFVWLVRYAWDWSERFMAPIHRGMTMAEVRKHLGPPPAVRTYASDVEVRDYHHWWSRDAYVQFDTNKTVWAIDTD